MTPLIQDAVRVALWTVAALMVLLVAFSQFTYWYSGTQGFVEWDPRCNVAVVPIVGTLVTAPMAPMSPADEETLDPWGSGGGELVVDTVRAELQSYVNDPAIQGVLFRIDSPGGTPVASEILMNEIRRVGLPTVALIREIGTSGAYWAATGANTVIASPLSVVGSIGVTASYLENSKKNTEEGLTYVDLSTGKFKDTGVPDRPLTTEERDLLMRDLKISHDLFVQEVAANRHLPIEKVAALADGSTMQGQQALDEGLIDTLGDQETARSWFAEKLGLAKEDVIFCE